MQPQAAPTRNLNAKLAIIPALAIALLWMLFGQSDKNNVEVVSPNASTVAQASAIPSELQDPVEQITRNWPEFDLEDVLGRDPFGGNPLLELPDAESNEGTPGDGEPEEWPVSVYMESKDGPIALANGHLLQQGDIVDKKWRVLAISNQSVVLEPIE